jgi:hypothetical protein
MSNALGDDRSAVVVRLRKTLAELSTQDVEDCVMNASDDVKDLIRQLHRRTGVLSKLAGNDAIVTVPDRTSEPRAVAPKSGQNGTKMADSPVPGRSPDVRSGAGQSQFGKRRLSMMKDYVILKFISQSARASTLDNIFGRLEETRLSMDRSSLVTKLSRLRRTFKVLDYINALDKRDGYKLTTEGAAFLARLHDWQLQPAEIAYVEGGH